MTTQEKLKALIRKAIKGGWNMFDFNEFYLDKFPEYVEFSDKYDAYQAQINTIVFNHDLAQALWGEHNFDLNKKACNKCGITQQRSLELSSCKWASVIVPPASPTPAGLSTNGSIKW